MKVFKIECTVFKFDVLVVTNCTHGQLTKYLKRNYQFELNDRTDSSVIGTMLTLDANPWRVVWVQDWKDKACLIHELFHLVTRVCYDRGIRIVSHDSEGNVADEPGAYMLEFLYAQCARRK